MNDHERRSTRQTSTKAGQAERLTKATGAEIGDVSPWCEGARDCRDGACRAKA